MRETMDNMEELAAAMSHRTTRGQFEVLEITPAQDYTPNEPPDEPEPPDNIVDHPTRGR